MEAKKRYKAKVLLFGEYSVIHGSDALAIPVDLFSGYWDFDQNQAKAQSILYDFHTYLSGLDFEKVAYLSSDFKKDLDRALFFNSTIPIGYGAGSSGAVCAAIFDCYFQKDHVLSVAELKQLFGEMESFFHGSSSGLDPLICYLNQSIMISNNKSEPIQLPLGERSFVLFLMDTSLPRRTEPLVNLYLEKYQSDISFKKAINEALSELNNIAIQQYIKKEDSLLLDTFGKISAFQWQYFQEMIPPSVREVWQKGMKSNYFKLKICGAGGGGFFLGITNNWEATTTVFETNKLYRLN